MSKLYVNEIYPQSGDTVTWNSALNATNNISSSGDFYSLGSVSASNNLAIGGNAEFSGTLKASELSSSGDIYALGSISASNDVTIGGNLYISGTILGITASNAVTALNNQAENRLVSIGSTTTELDGEANLTFDGSALTVAGNVSSSGDVYVLGSVSASNDVTIGGNLYISGTILGITASNAVTALNNQAENRLVSIGSTTTELDGEANLTFNGSVLAVAGNVSSSGDYYALGSISASNNLTVGGNIHASGTITCDALNVNEINSTSKTVNTLEIVDKVIVAASGTYPNNAGGAGLQIGGHSTGSAGTDIAATFFYNATDNSMDLSVALSSSGDLYSLGSISSSNNLAVGGNLHITGTINQATVNSYLTANDEARLKAGATVSGSLNAKSTLIVDDQTSLKAGATVSGSLHALGNTNLGNASSDVVTIAGSLTASAGLDLSGQRVLISGSGGAIDLSDARGNAEFSGSVVAGTLSSSGDVYSLGSISGSNNLAIGGNAELSGNVKIGTGGSTTFSVDTNGNVSASGDYYALGSVSASNNLAIGGNAEFSGSLSAASLSSSGDVYVLGSVSASNDVTVGGNLYISGTILGITASNAVTALNNQAENRLVSIGSTTTELDGEANLTFDGSVLTVAGNVSSSGDVYALGSVSASNNLAVGGNLHITGTLNKAYTSGGGHVSSSGDVYALGSVSASNNLAVGGNAQVSGSLSASLVYAYGLANAQSLSTITIPANYNSVLYGPISIDVSETVTIGVDSNVKIVDIADV